MRRSRLLPTALAVCVAIGLQVSAQSASYERILSIYRRGEHDAAVKLFSAMGVQERYRGASAVVRMSLRPFRRDVLQAVLALHTEGVLGGPLTLCDAPGSRRGTPDVREQELLGSGYPLFESALLETLKTYSPDDEFLRSWYVAVMAYDDRGFPGGRVCFENAPSRIRDHPEMQLALGAMHEKTWQQAEADGWFLPPFRPNLQDAERAFRRALQLAPDLHEARLRLGHVLVLQGRPDEALETLRQLRDDLDGGFAYVLRLVEGQAHEQRGDVDRARESYQAARAMFPHAQSAIMALAQLAYTQGHRAEALQHIQQLPGAATAGAALQPWVWYAEGADPWSWYYFGTAWRFPTYLARLRNLVSETR